MASANNIKISITSALNAAGIEATKKQVAQMSDVVQKSMQAATKHTQQGWADMKAVWDWGIGAVKTAWGGIQKLFTLMTSAFHFETLTTQFKTLIGNIDEAKRHMADLKALGDTPPFSLDAFAEASRELLVMTNGALGYKASLELIGDAAAATGRPLEQVSHQVGQLYAAIRDGQPLTRAAKALANLGIFTPEIVANLEEMQKKGASANAMWDEAEKVLRKYNGAMADTEQTGEGLMAALETRWENILRIFGATILNDVVGSLREVNKAAGELEESGLIEEWAEDVVEASKRAAGAIGEIFGAINDVWTAIKKFTGAGIAFTAGVFNGLFDSDNTYNPSNMSRTSWMMAETVDQFLRLAEGEESADVKRLKAREKEARRAERAAKAQADTEKRLDEEKARRRTDLTRAQQKRDEAAAKAAAQARIEEERKAAEEIARERELTTGEGNTTTMAKPGQVTFGGAGGGGFVGNSLWENAEHDAVKTGIARVDELYKKLEYLKIKRKLYSDALGRQQADERKRYDELHQWHGGGFADWMTFEKSSHYMDIGAMANNRYGSLIQQVYDQIRQAKDAEGFGGLQSEDPALRTANACEKIAQHFENGGIR